jgi:hypothetical protein
MCELVWPCRVLGSVCLVTSACMVATSAELSLAAAGLTLFWFRLAAEAGRVGPVRWR